MQSATVIGNYNIAGVGLSSNITRSADGGISQVVALPAGIAAQIAVGQGGLSGLPVGHGLVATNVVDISWPAGGVRTSRRGVTVDTADATDITFGAGGDPAAEGDAVPAAGTAVIVALQQSVDVAMSGDEAVLAALACDQNATADIREAADSALLRALNAGEAWTWVANLGDANPLAGKSLAALRVSNASAIAATLRFAVLYTG